MKKFAEEKIIAYNIGIALHDVFFASKIFNLLKDKALEVIDFESPKLKFWI